MSKKKPAREVVSETVTDPQQIAAAMEDTVDIVSEELPRSTAPSRTVTGGRLVAGKPSTVDLEDALAHWGLEPADVIGWAGGPEEGLRVVTAGGQKLHWPQDMDRVLTEAEKGRTTPAATGAAGGVGRFTREGGGLTRD
jgi:hypothetical protein